MDEASDGSSGHAAVVEKIDWPGEAEQETAAPARFESDGAPPPDAPQLYLMQFTTTNEHTELVERARALLSHRSPKVSLGELHLQAMRLLINFLEKQRFGSEGAIEPYRQPTSALTPRQRGRYVPARLRRAVYERDGGCCAYVDERGVRCGESRHIEVHHLHAFALGGEHELHNLALRCRARS